MLKKMVILLVAFLLAGCASTFSVKGTLRNSVDKFNGEINNRFDKSGTFTFTSLSGITCSGEFKFFYKGNGAGECKCGDGRSGTFMLSAGSYDGQGYGYGKLSDGEEFIFQVGKW